MAKKHKRQIDLRVGTAILVFILIILGAKNSSLFRSISDKVNPRTVNPTMDIMPPQELNTDQAAYVKLARIDLAAKLNISLEEVKVVKVKAKRWNDASLGCPQKGKIYVQSITEGFEIELSAGGENYIYNGGLNRVVTC